MAQFTQFFSLDSPKAIKAQKYGYMNAINYMAPADTAGIGNVCGDASVGCLALCLGWFSGQVGIVKKGTGRRAGANGVRKSRIAKVKMFMHDRAAFMLEMVAGIERAARKALRETLTLCVRPNGSSDIPWEHIKLSPIDRRTIFDMFPNVQFVDYTKSYKRMLRFLAGQLPPNYHLTFSRSETNEAQAIELLWRGANVSVVFAGDKPQTWNGFRVIDGDKHDLRHLDPRATFSANGDCNGGYVIGLSPKGSKAKHDQSGFVVRG
jgi:hypothetical protein